VGKSRNSATYWNWSAVDPVCNNSCFELPNDLILVFSSPSFKVDWRGYWCRHLESGGVDLEVENQLTVEKNLLEF